MICRRCFLFGSGRWRPFQARTYSQLDGNVAGISKVKDPATQHAVPNPNSGDTSTIEIPTRKLEHLDKYNRMLKIPQAWVTSLDTIDEKKHGIVDLHPDVFRTFPRFCIFAYWKPNHQNLAFQNGYPASKSQLAG